MPVSIAQAQKQLLRSGFLDSAASDRRNDDDIALNELSDAVILAGAEFADDARKSLIKADRVASGALSDSIEPKVVQTGPVSIVDVYVLDYYQYIDRGVKGYSGNGQGDFAFKSRYPSRAMVDKINRWLTSERKKIRNTKKAINPREQRRLSADPNARAFAVAMAVKKKGIAPSRFWTKAIQQLDQDLANKAAEAVRVDIIEQIAP